MRTLGLDRDTLQGGEDVVKTELGEPTLTDHRPFLKLRVGDQRDQTDIPRRHVEEVEMTDSVNNATHWPDAIRAMFAANVNQDVSTLLRAERESHVPALGITTKAVPEHAFAQGLFPIVRIGDNARAREADDTTRSKLSVEDNFRLRPNIPEHKCNSGMVDVTCA